MAGPETDLSPREFELLRGLIRDRMGIALNPHKLPLVRSRLAKRLRAWGLATYAEYYELLTRGGPECEEMGRLIDAITTTKTGFFREGHHFDYLADQWIPWLRNRAEAAGNRRIRIWSCGCSSGEEPYTIAMVLLDALGAEAARWDLRILASDINAEALARASAGVYRRDQTREVSDAHLKRHFLRGVGPKSGLVQVRPHLRSIVTFRRINLMGDWRIRRHFDAIFCRNVLIYFDRDDQKEFVRRFVPLLQEEGLLLLGHSENIHGWTAELQSLGNTIHRRTPSALTKAA
jgi:chemotaxis protein methyltransferase CheR